MRRTTLFETGLVPDWLIRKAIQWNAKRFVNKIIQQPISAQLEQKQELCRRLAQSPLAIHIHSANRQHYEMPTEFFGLFLGNTMKYSNGYWANGVNDLDAAQEYSLENACKRANLSDGTTILDLGCGWGALSLWIAERYKHCKIVALSNSQNQIDYIRQKAVQKGLPNIEAIKSNIADYNVADKYDLVMSIGMVEHLRNYALLMQKIHRLLRDGGAFYVDHFSHRQFVYELDHTNPDAWLANHFFTGGTIPSNDLLLYFQDELRIQEHWCMSGIHYQKTANAWLANFDRNSERAKELLELQHGKELTHTWYMRWRIFLAAIAEIFGFGNGEEYLSTQMLFKKS